MAGILLMVNACFQIYGGERMETGKVIGIETARVSIPGHPETDAFYQEVEVGKKILVGDAMFTVPNVSPNSFASSLKVGDCVKVRVHVYHPFFGKPHFIPDESRQIAPCS